MALVIRPGAPCTATDESACDADLACFWLERLARRESNTRDASRVLSTPAVRSSIDLIARADIKELSSVIGQLTSLWRGPHEDHRGTLRPSMYAFEHCVMLLVDASVSLYMDDERRVPAGVVSPDFEGGLRIEWVRPEANVHLVLAATKEGQSYIYHEEGDDFGVEEELTAERLASWLQLVCS